MFRELPGWLQGLLPNKHVVSQKRSNKGRARATSHRRCQRQWGTSGGLETLEARSLMSATPLVVGMPDGVQTLTAANQVEVGSAVAGAATKDNYQPLAREGLNLKLNGMNFNPHSDRRLSLSTTVYNAPRSGGDFIVRLYWSSTPSLQGMFAPATLQDRIVHVHAPLPSSGGHGVGISFDKNQLSAQPRWAKSIIAVLDPDDSVLEKTNADNAGYHLLSEKNAVWHPLSDVHAAPRTFVFLVPGFSTSSGATGMDKLATAIGKDAAFSDAIVMALPGSVNFNGSAELHDAQVRIDNQLRAFGATEQDRVVLIGHSYGGDVVRRMADDVSISLPGRQSAAAMITIDPISYTLTPSGQFNQSGVKLAAPACVAPGHVRNFVQQNPHETFRGYQMRGVTNTVVDYRGADGRANTADDVTHTSIDDSAQVQANIITALKDMLRA